MNIQLLQFQKYYREKFKYDDFTFPENGFMLVESGSFLYDSEEGQYTVKAGEGALFRKGVKIHRQVTQPLTFYMFIYRSNSELFNSCHVTFSDTSRIQSTISLLKELENDPFRATSEYHRYLFIDIVNQYAIEHLQDAANRIIKDRRMQDVVDYIDRHSHNKLVVSELAAQINLSYVQFLRRFEAHTGLSPSDYIKAIKLEKAKYLLLESDFLIKDIATMCGFENEYYFSNFIRKQLGISPSELRKMKIDL